ncbi:VanW family protein [Pseudoxanthomonas sp.]|uniref:VanW family protein n=1 Tax=Pseudoxanthomonas sp. TaxID=1871049 RepID=UPI002611BCDA|nr:VanW family protein [Pseudoxanthomonas sp.]WDS37896.1 MAG: VanW family protein [Pseudoxanthomonas sp.]
MERVGGTTPVRVPRHLPTRWDAGWFATKACLLRLQRAFRDLRNGPRRHVRTPALADAPILAASTAALWTVDDDDALLTAGKVQNLRAAAHGLHGVVVPAGQVLGFWKQVGRATRDRGFVVGRELREGCLVPSVGGGLCQLSNALYDAALLAGLEVVERHAHSRIVPGSQSVQGRDATVFWNYVDLRLRGAQAWRIEVDMDAQTLRVVIRGLEPAAVRPAAVVPEAPIALAKANACHTCDGVGCWRHARAEPLHAHRTWIRTTDEWPEFAADRAARCVPADRVLTLGNDHALLPLRLWRRWRQRGLPLPQRRLADAERQARLLAGQLHFTDCRLVIPQALLVPWWRVGMLAGRRFEVAMTALPAAALQARLDQAADRHGDSRTLVDFRVDATWLADEAAALARADAWITPHHGILHLAGKAGVALPWRVPTPALLPARLRRPTGPGLWVLLPASPLARKGIHALRTALQGSDSLLLLPPGAQESPGFWTGCQVRHVESLEAGIAQADVVVLPAWVEHQPRGLLLAMANDRPVIATAACGLPVDGRWHEVPAGDAEALKGALAALTQRRRVAQPEPA